MLSTLTLTFGIVPFPLTLKNILENIEIDKKKNYIISSIRKNYYFIRNTK